MMTGDEVEKDRVQDGVVVPLPLSLSRARATEIVRDIVAADRWSINIRNDGSSEWRQLVNRRQVQLCLKEGYILEDPEMGDGRCWRFPMARVCAGLNVTVEVTLQNDPALPRIFVVGIKGVYI